MADLRRPSKKKLPAWPKAPKSKTTQAVANYEKRVKEVAAKRKKIQDEFNKKMAAFKKQEAAKEKSLKGIAGIKAKY